MDFCYKDDELIHYRTPGSKNGVRLYQNEDGSLTPAGERRYLKGNSWSKHLKKSCNNEKSNSSHNLTIKKAIDYVPGKNGEFLRSSYKLYNDISNYHDKIKNESHSTKSDNKLKKINKYIKPVKYEIDKAIYSTNRLVTDLMKDEQTISEGSEFVDMFLNNASDYVNNRELMLVDLAKYLHKKQKENSENSHKYDKQIKSPSNWMSFGGGRPRIKQSK